MINHAKRHIETQKHVVHLETRVEKLISHVKHIVHLVANAKDSWTK